MGIKLESEFLDKVRDSLLVKHCDYLFSQNAIDKFLMNLEKRLTLICSDFYKKETKRIINESNYFILLFPELLTEEAETQAHEQLLMNFKTGKYPVLYRKMKEVSDLFVRNFNDMADRLSTRKKEIEETLFSGKTFSQVFDVVFDSEFGFSPILVTDSGKLVYKNHDCTLEFYFHALNKRFFSDIFRTPAIIRGDYDYGFCQFITNQVATNDKEAKEYYENMGSLSAVLCFIQAKGCHIKNILVNKTLPVVVNLRQIGFPDNNKAVYNDFSCSIAFREILPCQNDEGRENSPLLCCEEEPYCCLPVVDGRKETVLSYEKQFLDGFEKAFRYCISIKRQLLDWIEQTEDARVQFDFGNTKTYTDITAYLNKYSCLLSEDAQKTAIANACSVFVQVFPDKQILDECIKKTAIGELPYFFTKMKDNSLFSSSGLKLSNYYGKTVSEYIKDCIADQDENKLGFNLKLIKLSFSDCLVPENGKRELIKTKLTNKQRLDDLVKKLDDRFIKTPSGPLMLLGQVSGNSVNMLNDIGAAGKIGVALFLKAYSVCNGDVEYSKRASFLADSLVCEINEYLSRLDKNVPLGDCDGLSGMLKCALLMERMKKNDRVEALIAHICKRVSELNPKDIFGSDKYYGVAGLISVFCRFEELPDREQTVVKLSDRLLKLKTLEYKDFMLWETGIKNRVLSGAAHGMIGIFQALFLAYKLTGKKEYEKAAFDALEFENSIYSQKLESWPDLRNFQDDSVMMHGFCSGAPGIGSILVSLYEYRDCIPHYELNLERAINRCMNNGILYRDHICCGNGAVSDFMIDLYNKTGKEEYLEKAKSVLTTKNEFSFLPLNFRNTFVNSLYFGASGVGYELLRIEKPDFFESVLV